MTTRTNPAPVLDDPAQLVGSAATVAVDREPASAEAIREIIDAVAAAGFGGMSIWTDQFDWAVADGMSPQAYLDYHCERGLGVPTAEVVFLDWAPRWTSEGATGYAHQLDVTARMGAHAMIAVVLEPPPSVGRRPDAGLGQLCDLAGERGLRISLEFLPWSGVPGLQDAVDLLDIADRDNLGLALDSWHWFRQPGGPDEAMLRSLPAQLIDVLQLCDAPLLPQGDLLPREPPSPLAGRRGRRQSWSARSACGNGRSTGGGLRGLLRGVACPRPGRERTAAVRGCTRTGGAPQSTTDGQRAPARAGAVGRR